MQKSDNRSAGSASESKLHFLDYWRIIRVRFGIVLLSFLLVVITAAVATYFQPRKYQSAIKLELRTDQSAQSNPFRDNSYGMDPRLVATQQEIIRSKNILYPVIDSLGLMRRWASDGQSATREVAYYKLLRMLNLRQIRGTDFLELQVTSTDPREAAELVNAIAGSYSEAKRAVARGQGVEDKEALEHTLDGQRTRVKELEQKLTDFRNSHPGIRIAGPDTNASGAADPYEAQVASRQQEVDKFTTQVAALNSQLKQVEQLKGQELLRALSTLQLNDATIQKVLPLYQDAIANEAAMLQSGLGTNHPNVKAVRASKDVYASQLTEQVDSIKHSLAIQLEIAQSTLVSVTKQLKDLRGDADSTRTLTNEYNQLRDDYQKAQAVLDAAVLSASKTDITNAMPLRSAIQWEKAEPATYPSSPRVALNMALGILVGLLVGIGLAFFIEYLDTSVKTMDDVEAMLGVPVLAIIPKNIKLLHKCPSDVPDAEAYRILRTNIEFNRKSADANTISMVSGGPGEGKSTTLANLAFTCAQGGYSVLVVDADLRRPTQHKIFETSNEIGLTNYLTANMALDDVIVSTRIENLYLLPSGILPADAVGILNSQRMSDMIAELKTRYDIVFFDSPPILGVSDGAVLASEVDQSIIVVQHRRFPRALLQRVKQSVSSVGGTILGVVLNNVDLRHDPSYAYYTSYYDYYSARPSEAQQPAVASTGKATAGTGGPRSGGSRQADY